MIVKAPLTSISGDNVCLRPDPTKASPLSFILIIHRKVPSTMPCVLAALRMEIPPATSLSVLSMSLSTHFFFTTLHVCSSESEPLYTLCVTIIEFIYILSIWF